MTAVQVPKPLSKSWAKMVVGFAHGGVGVGDPVGAGVGVGAGVDVGDGVGDGDGVGVIAPPLQRS